MTNPFKDIDTFHTACDQTPSVDNYAMYLDLITEEYNELKEAIIAFSDEKPEGVNIGIED